MIAFLVVSIVLIVAPGPDTALTIRNTLVGGRGLATALGVTTGLLVWVLASAAGVTAVLVASRPAFEALRLLGAAYLVWLGLSTLFSHRHAEPRERRGSPYRQGLASNLANPKIAIFFTSLLPQFGASFAALTAHGVLFAGLTLVWLAFVARIGNALRRPAVRRAVDYVTGVVLVAFGVGLAAERR